MKVLNGTIKLQPQKVVNLNAQIHTYRRKIKMDEEELKQHLNVFPPSVGFSKIYNFREVPLGRNHKISKVHNIT